MGIGSILPFLGILLEDNITQKYTFLEPILQFIDFGNKKQLATYFLFFYFYLFFEIFIANIDIGFNPIFLWLDINLASKLFKKCNK